MKNGDDNRFSDFLRRLARVPKHEIDEQEREYQEREERRRPAKPREMIPPRRAS